MLATTWNLMKKRRPAGRGTHALIAAWIVTCCVSCGDSDPKTGKTGKTGNEKTAAGAKTGSADESSKTESSKTDNTAATKTNNKDDDNMQPPGEGQVLRHAVFFAFKEESTPEEVQSVADAFAALPSKIDSIKQFEWGTNNSPEGKDDGFTHCFVLTFDDGEGRAEYLPHPAHKAFGDVLRPHMADVFVIDYWGTRSSVELDKTLRHAVFFKFKDDASAEQVQAIEAAFAALPSKIDAIKEFEWGTNNSPEKHDDGFTHCFMVTFASEEGRAEYLPHEAHQEFVKLLRPSLDKVRVLDYWVEQ